MCNIDGLTMDNVFVTYTFTWYTATPLNAHLYRYNLLQSCKNSIVNKIENQLALVSTFFTELLLKLMETQIRKRDLTWVLDISELNLSGCFIQEIRLDDWQLNIMIYLA